MWPIINKLLDHYTTYKLKTAQLQSVFNVLSYWCYLKLFQTICVAWDWTVICMCCTGTWPSSIPWNHDSQPQPLRWSLCVFGCWLWFWPFHCVSFQPSKNYPSVPSATLPGRDLQRTLSCESYLNMHAQFFIFIIVVVVVVNNNKKMINIVLLLTKITI